jgi:lipoprotein-releasing system permease protein
VDNKFSKVTNIDSTIVRGSYLTGDSQNNYAVIGSGMFNKLNVNPSDAITPITAYAALKSGGPLSKDYATINLYPSGVFSIGSEEDGKYILTNIEAMRSLINKPYAFNSIEIRKSKNVEESKIISELKNILGDDVAIKNRYQQDEAFLRIMNIEKWIAYLIACLTLALITFNLIGALWMIVLDKKKDISILKSMGFTNSKVRATIISLGMLIGGIGLIFGLLLAIFFYILQKNYDLISLPQQFMVSAYPISLRFSDIILVSLTVLLLAFLASLLPSNRASKISAFVRQE